MQYTPNLGLSSSIYSVGNFSTQPHCLFVEGCTCEHSLVEIYSSRNLFPKRGNLPNGAESRSLYSSLHVAVLPSVPRWLCQNMTHTDSYWLTLTQPVRKWLAIAKNSLWLGNDSCWLIVTHYDSLWLIMTQAVQGHMIWVRWFATEVTCSNCFSDTWLSTKG